MAEFKMPKYVFKGIHNEREYSGGKGDFKIVAITINEIPPTNNKYMGNSRNFNEYRHEKERWHWLIKGAISKVQKPKSPFERAIVNITYYFKDKRRRDPDNYSGKMLLDPLVKEGILIDDSFDVVTLVLDGKVDRKNPRTEIEIRSIDNENDKKADAGPRKREKQKATDNDSRGTRAGSGI